VGNINKEKVLRSLELLFVISFMDLKLKYQNSILGFFWSFIKPFLQFGVYYTIFGLILKVSTGHDYPLRLFFGVLIWAWFAEATSLGLHAFIGKKSIITKIKTNKLFPPLSAFLSPTMNYCFNFIVFIVAYCAFMSEIPANLFTLDHVAIFIVSFLSISVLIISINLILSCMNVLYRDMQPIWELILTYGVFLTPIIYQLPIPERYQILYYSINLLAFPIENLKSIFFNTPMLFYQSIALTSSYFAVLMLLFLLACYVYRKLNNKLADFL